jgi:hypothetical protein
MANRKAVSWIDFLARTLASYRNAANNLSQDEFEIFWMQIQNESSKINAAVKVGAYVPAETADIEE